MTTTPLGKVAITPRGEYDSAASYERLDLVRYDGSAYLVLQPVTGVTPVDGDDYMLVVQKGDSIEYNGEEIASLSVGNNLAATYEEGGNLHLDIGSDIANHLSDTDNPHKVTAAQVGALSLAGGTLTGNLTIDGSDGDTQLIQFAGNTTLRNVKDSANYTDVEITADKRLVFNVVENGQHSANNILHSGNFSDYAVNKAGDTMSGPLNIASNGASSPIIMYTEPNGCGFVGVMGTDGVYKYIRFMPNTVSTTDTPHFVSNYSGSYAEYAILHTGNFSDYAVNKAGDTLHGSMYIQRAGSSYFGMQNTARGRDGFLELTSDDTVTLYNRAANDSTNRVALWLGTEAKSVEDLLRINHRVNSSSGTTYKVLHTGNKNLISPSDIGAAATATYTATVTATWIASNGYYYQDITVSGMLATDNPIVDFLPGTDNAANAVYSENMCKVLEIFTYANKIRVWATEAISSAFPIQLKVVR